MSTIIFLSVLFSGCSYMPLQNTDETSSVATSNEDYVALDHQIKTIFINDKPYEVELVTTPQSTAQGLSDREEIGADGMLFIFPNVQNRRFWMRNMRFDIDIVWIHDTKVVAISENVPAPEKNTPLNELKLYPSGQPVDTVLELPAGGAQQLDLTVGSQVRLAF